MPFSVGQGERHNLTARSVRASARPILAYKLRCSLPRNFPVVEYSGAPTASLEGWRGHQHVGKDSQSPSTGESALATRRI